MIVSYEPEFVFLEVPRTASRSMGRALQDISGSYRQYNHHNMEVPPEVRHFFTFACVRNPYSRAYSHYNYRKSNSYNNMYKYVHGQNWSFPRYLLWSTNLAAEPLLHDLPQSELLGGAQVDCVLKFEELPDCFHELPFVPGHAKLPHLNGVPISQSWQDAYTQETAKMVYEWARRDFDEYGYSADSWRKQDVPG